MKNTHLKALVTAAFLITSTSYAATPRERVGGGSETLPSIERMHEQLRLTPAQEREWQDIAQQAKALHERRRVRWEEIRKVYEDELAKPTPDLARITALTDEAHEQHSRAVRALEARRLALYATFSAEQKMVVRDTLKARLERRGRFAGSQHHCKNADEETAPN
jgi:protein CpxP